MAVHIDIDLSLDARIGIALIQGTRRQAGSPKSSLTANVDSDRRRARNDSRGDRDACHRHLNEGRRAPRLGTGTVGEHPHINTNVTFHFSLYGILLGHASDIAA
jgi:hypothetical protein